MLSAFHIFQALAEAIGRAFVGFVLIMPERGWSILPPVGMANVSFRSPWKSGSPQPRHVQYMMGLLRRDQYDLRDRVVLARGRI